MDDFWSQYIGLLNKEIESRLIALETQKFNSLDEVTKIQGELRGFRDSFKLLRSIPEKD